MSNGQAEIKEWCDCQHYAAEVIHPGQHGRCWDCYQNCPAVGGCKKVKYSVIGKGSK